MEKVAVISGFEDKMGGFEGVERGVNNWLAKNHDVEIVDRKVSLIERSSSLVMVVSIFYHEPSAERMFKPVGVVKN